MRFLRIIEAEWIKFKSEVIAYFPDHVTGFVTTLLFFGGFFLALGGFSKDLDPVKMKEAIVGFLIWFFSINIIWELPESMMVEKITGTLEQIMIRPLNIFTILAAKSISRIIFSIIEIIFLFCLFSALLKQIIFFPPIFFLILFITIIGLSGFGLFLTALTIAWTKTGSFGTLIQYFLLVFTGTFFDVNSLPKILQYITKFLPLTIGIETSQKIIVHNYSINSMSINLVFLILSSLFYLSIGVISFNIIFRYARKHGIYKGY